MFQFSNPRYYAKGICDAMLTEPATGVVKYHSNKFTTGNITTEVSLDEIRAGLGNGVAAIIPSNSGLKVDFASQDLNLFAKAAQVGATMSYGAPVMVCKVVTATSAQLEFSVADGVPVAQLGFNVPYAYVQTVGEKSLLEQDGVPYEIDYNEGALSAVVSGFTATVGKEYKILYYVSKATAQVAALGANFDPQVLHFTARIAVYANNGNTKSSGTRVGWLYIIVPRLKLGGDAGVTGDQTNNDTTKISGQALTYDNEVVSANCNECENGNFAYYVFVKDDSASDIVGLALIGGEVSVGLNTTAKLGFRYVLADGSTVLVNDNAVSYAMEPAIEGVSISELGVVTTGDTPGDTEITATFGEITAKATLTVA